MNLYLIKNGLTVLFKQEPKCTVLPNNRSANCPENKTSEIKPYLII